MSTPIIDQRGESAADSTVSYLKDLEERILHLLSIYPKLSPSMLQIGIGSSIPPKVWRPVLQDLIDRKIVVQESLVNLSPKGRSQTHLIISLMKPTDKWLTNSERDALASRLDNSNLAYEDKIKLGIALGRKAND